MTEDKNIFHKREFDAAALEKIANILKAISHPVRLDIIRVLEEMEPLTVAQINVRIPVEQSLLSHHLTKMKDKGVLKSTREGKNIYYRMASRHITAMFDCMEKCDLV